MAAEEQGGAEARRAALPDPAMGRAALAAAQARHDGARTAMQAATAALAAHDQALAVLRERTAAQRSDIKGWQARAGDAANRLAEMARRSEDVEEERAVIAAKPAGLLREIEQGDAIRTRLGAELEAAEAALEATKLLVAQHGKAAAFQEKSRGLQDAGATVACFIITTMSTFVNAA